MSEHSNTDEFILQALNDKRDEAQEDLDKTRRRIQGLEQSVRRYNKAIAALSGEPAQSKPPRKVYASDINSGTKVGPERLDLIRNAVRLLAAERGEFRQVDLSKSGLLDFPVSSSVASGAFRQLRDEGLIRVSRVVAASATPDQRGKFYRLTHATETNINGSEDTT